MREQVQGAGQCWPATIAAAQIAGPWLLPQLWLVLVGALHIPSTQVTVSRNAAVEQSASAASCTLLMRREPSLVSDAVACAGMQIGRHAACCMQAGTDLRGMLTSPCSNIARSDCTLRNGCSHSELVGSALLIFALVLFLGCTWGPVLLLLLSSSTLVP